MSFPSRPYSCPYSSVRADLLVIDTYCDPPVLTHSEAADINLGLLIPTPDAALSETLTALTDLRALLVSHMSDRSIKAPLQTGQQSCRSDQLMRWQAISVLTALEVLGVSDQFTDSCLSSLSALTVRLSLVLSLSPCEGLLSWTGRGCTR
jgi:hypothetical protein